MNTCISKLRLMDEKSQSINDQQLIALEEKFEVFVRCSGPSNYEDIGLGFFSPFELFL